MRQRAQGGSRGREPDAWPCGWRPVAAAQVRGIPVYNSGVPRGIAIYGDVGFSDDNAGKGTAFAVSGRAGFGPFGATAILSTFNPDGPASSDVSVGATLNYKIFGGPLVPLSVTFRAGSATRSRTPAASRR